VRQEIYDQEYGSHGEGGTYEIVLPGKVTSMVVSAHFVVV
jgi:hypothetical protein